MSTGPSFPSNIGRWVIGAVVAIGIIAVLYVMAGAAGVAIPGFVVTLFWIVLAVVLCVAVVRFLLYVWGGGGV